MERMAGAGFKSMTQAVLVTPTRLLWAQATDDEEAFARSELLAKLEVTDYEKGPAFALMPDHGVEVQGVAASEGRVGTLFFGLGEGPDADQARHVLKAAVKAAHGEGPPVTRRDGSDTGDSSAAGRAPCCSGAPICWSPRQTVGGPVHAPTIACRRCGRTVTCRGAALSRVRRRPAHRR